MLPSSLFPSLYWPVQILILWRLFLHIRQRKVCPEVSLMEHADGQLLAFGFCLLLDSEWQNLDSVITFIIPDAMGYNAYVYLECSQGASVGKHKKIDFSQSIKTQNIIITSRVKWTGWRHTHTESFISIKQTAHTLRPAELYFACEQNELYWSSAAWS